MCLTYIVQRTDPSLLLYLDERYLSSRTVERAKSSAKLINLSNAFNINGSSMIPDAIVFESITHKIKDKKTYKVYADNWNDYGYQTRIDGLGITANVGYIGQGSDHTIQKLQEFYKSDRWGHMTTIDAPLPPDFYSFWEISFPLDSESLHKMYYFNHFFYLPIKKQIMDWDRFNKEILQPLGIFSGPFYQGSRSDVFNASLFRDQGVEWMREKFNNFIRQFLNQDECFYEIIDIKYLDTKYFRDSNKIEEIKRRSIRKQFVYEHLLQKTLEKRKDQYSNLSIRSSFWLPSYLPDDSELLQDSSTFMDGYIKLKNVNFKLLAETYFA